MGKPRLTVWGLANNPQGGSEPEGCRAGSFVAQSGCAAHHPDGSSPTLSEAGTEAQRRTETCSKAHSLWWLSPESGRGFGAQFSHCAARSGPERGPSKPTGELGTGQIPTRRPSAEGACMPAGRRPPGAAVLGTAARGSAGLSPSALVVATWVRVLTLPPTPWAALDKRLHLSVLT